MAAAAEAIAATEAEAPLAPATIVIDSSQANPAGGISCRPRRTRPR
mgnify:CR=1 FL=1